LVEPFAIEYAELITGRSPAHGDQSCGIVKLKSENGHLRELENEDEIRDNVKQ